MEYLKTLLAGLIDKFKAKNPLVYALIITFLMVADYGLGVAVDNGALVMSETIAKIIDYVGVALLALTGSRTVRYMKPEDGPAQAVYNSDYRD